MQSPLKRSGKPSGLQSPGTDGETIMQSRLTDREIIFYLRGFAIGSVVINHYLTTYVSESFNGYANGIIAVFFVLSGYGIFHSLSRSGRLDTEALLKYLYKRFIRIYPLYWVSLMITILTTRNSYGLKTILAIPFFQAPGIYWFITSLVQCYLAAPLLFILIRKYGYKKYIAGVFSVMLLVYLLYQFAALPYSRDLFVYRYLFLSHIFLFASGMAVPSIIENHRARLDNGILAAASFVFFLASVYWTREADTLFPSSAIYIAPLFVTGTVFFCLCVISTTPLLIFRRTVVLMGAYSYSLFLFHTVFFIILSRYEIIKGADLRSITLILLLFPVFLLGCIMLEKSTSHLNNILTAGRRACERLYMRYL